VGKTAASIPRGTKHTPGYVKKLKLIWCGDFKINLGSYFGIPGRLSSKCFVTHRWFDMGIAEREEAVCFQLFRFVFCLLICDGSGCTFLSR
jgi:hypothetical protein